MVLTLLGIAVGMMRFVFGIKPALLTVKVFAVYAVFFNTNRFAVIQNNVMEELAGILLLVGLVLWGFSEERYETDEVREARCAALFVAVLVNSVLLVSAMMFVYGLGFAAVVAGNVFSLPVIYLLLFNWSLYRKRRRGER